MAKRHSYYIIDVMDEAIERQIEAEGISRSAFVARALLRALPEKDQEIIKEELGKRALRKMGDEVN